ncbi:hypothetical protein CEXT_141421 [Caerostris extrusa]|uniref:Uncharacterized protein n=1 Tax=Caerostris extrusa TaxID=172846 RepID=A0AAV4WWJ0_CAEEX|nr:hypothetical protein CEXT_141421 [Caerostris extrusa]
MEPPRIFLPLIHTYIEHPSSNSAVTQHTSIFERHVGKQAPIYFPPPYEKKNPFDENASAWQANWQNDLVRTTRSRYP